MGYFSDLDIRGTEAGLDLAQAEQELPPCPTCHGPQQILDLTPTGDQALVACRNAECPGSREGRRIGTHDFPEPGSLDRPPRDGEFQVIRIPYSPATYRLRAQLRADGFTPNSFGNGQGEWTRPYDNDRYFKWVKTMRRQPDAGEWPVRRGL
jgi:hypothetical protein